MGILRAFRNNALNQLRNSVPDKTPNFIEGSFRKTELSNRIIDAVR